MRNKYIFFILFIAFLYIFFVNINYKEYKAEKQRTPDVILKQSKIEHFVSGKKKFTLKAEVIEVFPNDYQLSKASFEMFNGLIISADQISLDIIAEIMFASNNVIVEDVAFLYNGNKVIYDLNGSSFVGYDRGVLTTKGDNLN